MTFLGLSLCVFLGVERPRVSVPLAFYLCNAARKFFCSVVFVLRIESRSGSSYRHNEEQDAEYLINSPHQSSFVGVGWSPSLRHRDQSLSIKPRLRATAVRATRGRAPQI